MIWQAIEMRGAKPSRAAGPTYLLCHPANSAAAIMTRKDQVQSIFLFYFKWLNRHQ